MEHKTDATLNGCRIGVTLSGGNLGLGQFCRLIGES
jgi:hypothetical protein